MIEAGRRKIANRVSPDARMVTLTEIDNATSIVEPQDHAMETDSEVLRRSGRPR
jgi:hypothetical protein